MRLWGTELLGGQGGSGDVRQTPGYGPAAQALAPGKGDVTTVAGGTRREPGACPGPRGGPEVTVTLNVASKMTISLTK